MSDEKHVFELIPGYALDCLDEDEHRLVATHLTTCAACQAELDIYQMVVEQLSLTLPETTESMEAEPSPQIEARLLAHVRASASSAPASLNLPEAEPNQRWLPNGFWPRVALAWSLLSLLFIIILGANSLLLWQRLNQLETITQPTGQRAIAVPLNGTDFASEASGFIIIGAEGMSGAIVVDDLPQLEPDREYQLWLIRDEDSVSGAVFSVDEAGYGGARISAPSSLFDYPSFEIRIEAAGGSPYPTGYKVLAGTLSTTN